MGLSSNPSHTTLQNYKKPNYQSVPKTLSHNVVSSTPCYEQVFRLYTVALLL
jgi:hypothetical protein